MGCTVQFLSPLQISNSHQCESDENCTGVQIYPQIYLQEGRLCYGLF